MSLRVTSRIITERRSPGEGQEEREIKTSQSLQTFSSPINRNIKIKLISIIVLHIFLSNNIILYRPNSIFTVKNEVMFN